MMFQEETPRLFRLAAGVELLSGPDEMPLLYVSEQKSYLRLSAAGAMVIRLLRQRCAMPLSELVRSLTGQAEDIEMRRQVIEFMRQLDQAGALEADAAQQSAPASPLRRLARRVAAKPRLELALWHPDRPLAARLLGHIQTRLGHLLGKLIALLILLAVISVTYVAITPLSAHDFSRASWLLICVLLALHTIGHELAHALVSSYYGIKVREMGVALLYYFIPVAYTDRTDAYRLRHFRQRAYIALSGLVFDLLATGLSALIAGATSGWLGTSFQMLMWGQLAGLISNLNPLLPGDACHALEAWFGALNFRRRAFTLFWRRLARRELPPYLQSLTLRQQVFHFAYAALASAYVLLLAWLSLGFIIHYAVAR
jgi:putative peptide zinc metalloprotease protein